MVEESIILDEITAVIPNNTGCGPTSTNTPHPASNTLRSPASNSTDPRTCRRRYSALLTASTPTSPPLTFDPSRTVPPAVVQLLPPLTPAIVVPANCTTLSTSCTNSSCIAERPLFFSKNFLLHAHSLHLLLHGTIVQQGFHSWQEFLIQEEISHETE